MKRIAGGLLVLMLGHAVIVCAQTRERGCAPEFEPPESSLMAAGRSESPVRVFQLPGDL